MPVWDMSVESSGGILNLYTFSVVRIAEYEYSSYAHLLITNECIEEIHEMNQIRFKRVTKFAAWR